jgi:hypothetical protein
MIPYKKYISLFFFLFLLLFFTLVSGENDDFFAYYTKLQDDYPNLIQYQDSLFGRYADVIVKVGSKGQIVFGRETSYLPVWKTKDGEWTFNEIIARKGDGDKGRPDVISRYSYVRIIEQNPDQIIIHWRYFPDFNRIEWGDVVEEYFYIKPDGGVLRSIRKATSDIDEWNNKENILTQKIVLHSTGIDNFALHTRKNSGVLTQLGGKPSIIPADSNLILQFRFDQNTEKTTLESVSGQTYNIKGHKALSKRGISLDALNLDGYYSGVSTNNISISALDFGFTISGWVALGAYPFDWAPLIHQSEWQKRGFYLGIDQNGYPGFHLGCGSQWISVVDSTALDLFQWYNLSAVYNAHGNKISLLINGNVVAKHNLKAEKPNYSSTPLLIGLNREKMPPSDGRIRRGKWPSLFGIDGLIDEVTISPVPYSPDEIKNHIQSLNISPANLSNPDLNQRSLPEIEPNGSVSEFSAQYTKFKYYDTWDNLWRVGDYPDIVVSFENFPTHIVFWRGTSYGPFFVTENGKWIGDQSNEDYRLLEYPGEAEGCLEHMSDKQCRHSHVRIIENTPARKVIHWRYGLVDSRYYFAPWNGGWGGWTDEYWTIYPDGVAIRNVTRGIVFGDGWVETMFLSAPGSRPEDNCELQAYTVLDESEKIHRFSWEDEAPEGVVDDVMLTIVNSKSKYRMFNVYPRDSFIEIFGGHSRRSKFHWWNHWPVSQITSDGRGARAADRLAHSSLAHGGPGTHYLLYGISDKSIDDLKPVAKFWRTPPEISDAKGIKNISYLQEERSWHLIMDKDDISFNVAASIEQPVYNPVFVLKNCIQSIKSIKINDQNLTESKYRIGLHRSDTGLQTVLWLEYQSEKLVNVQMIFN